MSGRTVVYTLNNTHEKSVSLNTSALAAGSYLLVLETADGQVRHPLQKVN
jgi:hypothetical protein